MWKAIAFVGLLFVTAHAAEPVREWPMFGGTPGRNMVTRDVAPFMLDFPASADGLAVRVLGKRVRWKADLGSFTNGTPVVAGGRVYVGTNNERARNDRDRRKAVPPDTEREPMDKAILMCFDEATGKFLWQMVHDKLERGPINDWPRMGIWSSPVVEGEQLYYVSNRGEVVCLDVNGMANGNQGYAKEKYTDKTDGDVLWLFDMRKELGVEPHQRSTCSPLLVGDLLFVVTGNGVDEAHTTVVNPEAPSFLCLSKHTGRLLWKSNLPGKKIMHGQWSNPTHGVFGGQATVIFPGGDGWLYGFEPETGKLLWRFDANMKDAKQELGGRGTKNDFLGTPVVYQELIYIGTGQDPEHLEGMANFWCLSPKGKSGDISAELEEAGKAKSNPNSGVVWRYGGLHPEPNFDHREFLFGRTLSTACIVDDVVYLAELTGYVHCLDAKTGKRFWRFDTKGAIFGSCYHLDGKIIVGNEEGDLFIFKHDNKPPLLDRVAAGQEAARAATNEADRKKAFNTAAKGTDKALRDNVLLQVVQLEDVLHTTPVFANGVLYVATAKTLYAVAGR